MVNRPVEQPNRCLTMLASTATVLKSFILPAATATVALECHNEIQKLRLLDASPLKDCLKNCASGVSSTVSAFTIGYSNYEFVSEMIKSGVWSQLSVAQRIAITTLVALGTISSGYSMLYFGSEQNTLAAGLNAAGGVLAYNLAGNIATLFPVQKQDNAPDETSALLSQPAPASATRV